MKNKLLSLLKECDGYLSGEELGEKLGVSRAAIWKNIAKLKEMGYNIQAVTNKGYKLLGSSIDILNEAEIKQGLNTSLIGNQIFYFDTVGSTNDELRKLGDANVCEGAAVIANTQTGGKGRRGKVWISPEATGIWVSLLLRPDIAPMEAPRLTLVAGLCMCKAIRETTGLDALIKWPNDLMIGDKKICGILTEMIAETDRVNYIICGIGVNVNDESFPEELQNIATSLRIEGNRQYERKIIIQKFFEAFEDYYKKFITTNNFEIFLDEYKKYCLTMGKEITVMAKESYNANAIDINSQGELIVKKDDGSVVTVFSGEVSIRRV